MRDLSEEKLGCGMDGQGEHMGCVEGVCGRVWACAGFVRGKMRVWNGWGLDGWWRVVEVSGGEWMELWVK